MDADVAYYIGKCLLCLTVGWSAGILHRHYFKVVESMTSGH